MVFIPNSCYEIIVMFFCCNECFTLGTGKSFLIKCIRKYMSDTLSPSSVVVCAPTGTAAFNIAGRTVHSVFSLPVPIPSHTLKPLQSQGLLAFQQRLGDVKLIIIDEMSMIGRRMLRCLDLRLRQVHPRNADRPFGGISVCLFGDFGQLPPVGDKAMFDTRKDSGTLSNDARQSFKTFKQAVVLTRVERVRGEDEAQASFRDTLLHFRNGQVNEEDGKMLSTRLVSRLTDEECLQFSDAPYLVSTRKQEGEVNYTELRNNAHPICKINAVHKPAAAAKQDAKDAMGLQPVLRLSKGAKVMLRSNLWVSAGLTNGSLGVVHGILYDPESSSPPALPAAVAVEFPCYQGPPWDPNHPKVVPITPTTAQWQHKNFSLYSRTQVPLTLAYAVTIHKSQGWTRERIKLDIGQTEWCGGLSFVAFSRVKSLNGLLIQPQTLGTFTNERLMMVNNLDFQKRRRYVDNYMTRLSNNTA